MHSVAKNAVRSAAPKLRPPECSFKKRGLTFFFRKRIEANSNANSSAYDIDLAQRLAASFYSERGSGKTNFHALKMH